MRAARLVSVTSLLAALLALPAGIFAQGASAPPAPPPPQNVILISWDGLDRSVLKELLEAGKLPNLAALIKAGSLQDIEVTGHQTETAPGHAQMLTGLGPEQSKVRGNGDYEPIPEGLTIFERVQKQLGGPAAVATIMVMSKMGYLGGEEGEPYANARKHVSLFSAAWRLAAQTGPACLRALEAHHAPRFLAFFHFLDTDSAGHGFGIDSDEYRKAAVDEDRWLGRIVAWLKENKLDGGTLIYVTADHGFDPNGFQHHNAPHVWLATNDTRVTHGGIQADVPATILARFGVDLSKLKPKLVGSDLSQPAESPAKQPEPVGAVR